MQVELSVRDLGLPVGGMMTEIFGRTNELDLE